MKPYSGEALSATQVTLINVCDGCALLLGCAFRAHAARFSSELMPSSFNGQDVFVHGGFPFGPIASQLLPGVRVDPHTYKISFDYVFEVQIGTADWALALSEHPVQDVFRDATVLHSTNVAQPTQSALSREGCLTAEG